MMEGGGYCNSMASCSDRSKHSQPFTSSKQWSKTLSGEGITSLSHADNKLFSDANIIRIPYCSQDLWLGNTKQRVGDHTFHFKGSQIISQTVQYMLKARRLKRGSEVIIAGSSAGGIGVINNIDAIGRQIRKRNRTIKIRGLVDSGYFILKNSVQREELRKSLEFWDVKPNVKCLEKHSSPTECTIGHDAINAVKSDLFIIQFAFDNYQLLQDMKHNATTSKTRNNSLPALYSNVPMLSPQFIKTYRQDHFSLLCRQMRLIKKATTFTIANWRSFQHVVLNRPNWLEFDNGKIELKTAIQCWRHNGSRGRCKRYKSKLKLSCRRRTSSFN